MKGGEESSRADGLCSAGREALLVAGAARHATDAALYTWRNPKLPAKRVKHDQLRQQGSGAAR